MKFQVCLCFFSFFFPRPKHIQVVWTEARKSQILIREVPKAHPLVKKLGRFCSVVPVNINWWHWFPVFLCSLRGCGYVTPGQPVYCAIFPVSSTVSPAPSMPLSDFTVNNKSHSEDHWWELRSRSKLEGLAILYQTELTRHCKGTIVLQI